MCDYKKHFIMKNEDVINYVKTKLPNFFLESDELTCKEIGDGNMNYIFQVSNQNHKSLILKQADDYARIPPKPADIKRNKIEVNSLRMQSKFAKEFVPEVYFYDEVMSVIFMEDLSSYENLRYALMEGKIPCNLGYNLGKYFARTLMPNTDFFLSKDNKLKLLREYDNPGMVDISRRLVFIEPYNPLSLSNNLFEPNKEFLEKELYEDEELKKAVLKLKESFLNDKETLLHGDMHTGSVFIKDDLMKVLDPEFAMFGPIGYDLGNITANLIIAWVRAYVNCSNNDFLHKLAENIKDVFKYFLEFSYEVLNDNKDKLLKPLEDFKEVFKAYQIQSLKFCGTEIIRRVIGCAHVKDITTLNDQKRMIAERILVKVSKSFIKEAVLDIDKALEILQDRALKLCSRS